MNSFSRIAGRPSDNHSKVPGLTQVKLIVQQHLTSGARRRVR
ncbi:MULTISPECIES: hypothetical protein [unclassified Caballeronia]